MFLELQKSLENAQKSSKLIFNKISLLCDIPSIMHNFKLLLNLLQNFDPQTNFLAEFIKDSKTTCEEIIKICENPLENEEFSGKLTVQCEHLDFISKSIAIFIYENINNQNNNKNLSISYEEILKNGEDSMKIKTTKRAVKFKLESLKTTTENMNNFYIKGMCFFNGHGQPQNIEKSLKYLQKAENLGSAKACTFLAELCERGIGQKKNLEKAMAYYKKGAERGDSSAFLALARLNEKEKIQNLEAASELGSSEAMVKIGEFYENGENYMKDKEKAFEFYKKAVAAGSGLACNYIGLDFYEKEDLKNAFIYFQKGAILKNSQAMNNLGKFYENGLYCPKNEENAIKYYEECARNKYIPGMLNFARMLVKKGNYEKAAFYYRIIIIEDQNNSIAHLGLGELYEKGLGVELNYETAFIEYKKAAELGNSNAYKKCADLMYTKGKLNTPDIQGAISLYNKAIELGNSEALNIMGGLYETGKIGFLEQSNEKAAELYEKAWNLGNLFAGVNFIRMMLEINEEINSENAKNVWLKILEKCKNDKELEQKVKEYAIKRGIEITE